MDLYKFSRLSMQMITTARVLIVMMFDLGSRFLLVCASIYKNGETIITLQDLCHKTVSIRYVSVVEVILVLAFHKVLN